MQNNAIDLLLIAFLSGVVGSYFVAGTRQRANLVRAGFMSAVPPLLRQLDGWD